MAGGSMAGRLRKSGIDIIGDVNWGTHFCFFYRDQNDLLEMLVPYFKAGLENNEFCMWVTSEPLNADDARQALTAAIPNLSEYINKKQIEIISYSEWYTRGGSFDSRRVLNGWVAKLTGALSRGLDGLRLSGNTFWLEKRDWQAFTDYEAEVNSVIGKYRMIAICTYALEKCGAQEVVDVVRNHQFALIKQAHDWEFIEASNHRKTREALRKSRQETRETGEKLTAVLESISDGFFTLEGNDLKVTYFNQAAEKLLGRRRDKVIGQPLFDAFPEARGSIFEKKYRKALKQKKTEIFETYFGVAPYENWYEVRAHPYDNGLSVFFQVTTKRRNVEEELRVERDALTSQMTILDAIMENTGAMLVYLDPQFNFVKANSAYVKACGHSLEELIGRNHFDLFPNAENQAIFEKVRDTGLPVSFHDKPFTYAGQPERGVTYWDWTLVAVIDTVGKVQGLVFSLIETTERVRAEQRLAVRERLATIGELAGSISHEIRNPLAAIDSSAFFLSKTLKGANGKAKVHIERIHSSVQRATGIIQSLMNLTRMERPRLSGLDLRAVVSESITAAKVPASVKVRTNFPKDTVLINADWEQLQMAFRNLVTNAFQAMDHGGILTVSITKDDNEAVLSFADTGPGIAPHYIDKLFTPLFTTKAQGIGFGLSIAKMIVERHGGKITVQSGPDKGANFTIRLPLRLVEAKEAILR